MERLEHTFGSDTLYKMLLMKHPDLLKRLVAELLDIRHESIEQFAAAAEEFRKLERMRSDARRNEASALYNARREEREKWQKVVEKKDAAIADIDAVIADKDAILAHKDAVIADKDAILAHKDAVIADKDAAIADIDAAIADRDAEIARLRELLGEDK